MFELSLFILLSSIFFLINESLFWTLFDCWFKSKSSVVFVVSSFWFLNNEYKSRNIDKKYFTESSSFDNIIPYGSIWTKLISNIFVNVFNINFKLFILFVVSFSGFNEMFSFKIDWNISIYILSLNIF